MDLKSLREILDEIPDESSPYLYPLGGVLTLICLGMMCGLDEIRAIARWGKELRWDLSSRLGFPNDRMPSFTTLQMALKRVDRDDLMDRISAWGEAILTAYGHEGWQGLALDGKKLRGSRTEELPAVHLLAAFAHEFHVLVGQVQVSSKRNEISGIHPLLAELTLENRVVTVDAMLTQRHIAETIREKKGII